MKRPYESGPVFHQEILKNCIALFHWGKLPRDPYAILAFWHKARKHGDPRIIIRLESVQDQVMDPYLKPVFGLYLCIAVLHHPFRVNGTDSPCYPETCHGKINFKGLKGFSLHVG